MRDMRDKGEKRCVSNIVQYMQGNIYIINRACNICEDGAFDIQTHSGHGKIAFCQDNFSLNWSRREDRIFLNCTKECARYLIKAIALV